MRKNFAQAEWFAPIWGAIFLNDIGSYSDRLSDRLITDPIEERDDEGAVFLREVLKLLRQPL